MTCPGCNAERMDGGYIPLVKSNSSFTTDKFSHNKSWHYRCEECDSEWVKVGYEKLRLLDGMVR